MSSQAGRVYFRGNDVYADWRQAAASNGVWLSALSRQPDVEAPGDYRRSALQMAGHVEMIERLGKTRLSSDDDDDGFAAFDDNLRMRAIVDAVRASASHGMAAGSAWQPVRVRRELGRANAFLSTTLSRNESLGCT